MTVTAKEILDGLERLLSYFEYAEPIDDGAFGKCPSCGYVFNSELINEYEIKHCPCCGQRIAPIGEENKIERS